VIPLAEIDELERCVVAANGNTAVRERLRALRRASRRLVVKPAEDAGVWLVGEADDLRHYTPRGGGFDDLLVLLARPNQPVPAEDLPGGGTARVACQRAHRAAEHLAARVPCFVFVPGCIRQTKPGAVTYDPSRAAPRIDIGRVISV